MKKSEEYTDRLQSESWDKKLCERICAHRDQSRAKQSRWVKLSLLLVIAVGVFATNYAIDQDNNEEMTMAIGETSVFVPVSYTVD